jgi:hypothetical protein
MFPAHCKFPVPECQTSKRKWAPTSSKYAAMKGVGSSASTSITTSAAYFEGMAVSSPHCSHGNSLQTRLKVLASWCTSRRGNTLQLPLMNKASECNSCHCKACEGVLHQSWHLMAGERRISAAGECRSPRRGLGLARSPPTPCSPAPASYLSPRAPPHLPFPDAAVVPCPMYQLQYPSFPLLDVPSLSLSLALLYALGLSLCCSAPRGNWASVLSVGQFLPEQSQPSRTASLPALGC